MCLNFTSLRALSLYKLYKLSLYSLRKPSYTDYVCQLYELSLPDQDTLEALTHVGDLAVYGGGGYVAELSGTMNEIFDLIRNLSSEGWIDRRTRFIKVYPFSLSLGLAHESFRSTWLATMPSFIYLSALGLQWNFLPLVAFTPTPALIRSYCFDTTGIYLLFFQ